jgi:hypothetical protein
MSAVTLDPCAFAKTQTAQDAPLILLALLIMSRCLSLD